MILREEVFYIRDCIAEEEILRVQIWAERSVFGVYVHWVKTRFTCMTLES